MKNILRDKLGRFKSLGINLLDGQRRGEVVFRRVFLLVVLYTLVVLIGKLITTKPNERVEIKEVEAKEVRVWEGDQKIEIDENGKKWYIHDEYDNYVPEPEEIVETEGKGIVKDSVSEFIKSYGGRIDDNYLALLRENCNEEAVKIVVAISVAETSMGKKTNKATNYFGWHKGSTAYDPSVEEMAAEICRGVQKSYMSIGKDARVTGVYTGSDRVDSWTKNFNWALAQM
jgi:hypothetical protein